MLVLKGFFVNFSILCTGIFLFHQYFISKRVSSKPSIQKRLLAGILYGLFGALLMQFGIPITGGVLIDLRSIPIMIASYTGGWVASLASAVVIIIFRFLLYPISNSSYLNIFTIMLSVIAFSVISQSPIKRKKKWMMMCASFIIILGATIPFVIPDIKMGIMIFAQYSFSICCATFGTYILKAYLWRSDASIKKLKEFAQKDYLTGLNNSRSFHTEINSLMSKANEHKEELSLIIADIDYFKHVNDTYGHPVGDKILQQLGEILVKSCRSVDIVSRNGGEEFSIILPACDFHTASVVAESLRRAVEMNTFTINEDVTLKITVSIGYATTTTHELVTVQELINQADEGLYYAKRNGRNRISSLYKQPVPV